MLRTVLLGALFIFGTALLVLSCYSSCAGSSTGIRTRKPGTSTKSVMLRISFTGIILFFFFAFSNPFKEPGALTPDGYRHLIAQFDQERRTPTP